MPKIYQAVQAIQQAFDITKVQAGGRFIQDIELMTALEFGEFFDQLDALGFSTRERVTTEIQA